MLLPFFFTQLLAVASAKKATYGSTPQGSAPLLYSADDHVIQLDETTFNETVYCKGEECSAYVIEFYADWCGHCRDFAPLYKQLAQDVKGWQRYVKLAVMNCADSFNLNTCRANNITMYPMVKYFPRYSQRVTNSFDFEHEDVGLQFMRSEIAQILMNEKKYKDWPNFDRLKGSTSVEKLWTGISEYKQYLAVIVEENGASTTGAELILDYFGKNDTIALRRSVRSEAWQNLTKITEYPSLVVFKRGRAKPVYSSDLRNIMSYELEHFLINGYDQPIRTPIKINCEVEKEKCRSMYYVSEVDMLKSMRYALVDEVIRTGLPLGEQNLTALYTFIKVLRDKFPFLTHSKDSVSLLDSSYRAVSVFDALANFLGAKIYSKQSIESAEWLQEFESSEKKFGNPFPSGSVNYDHCRGSESRFRGYTCGLWTTFHALTVNAYKTMNKGDDPLMPLKAIQSWVRYFFGCEVCQQHFLHMTTEKFSMEEQVKKPEDVYLYLFRAHNIVNDRLSGDNTEDPRYPKHQFPGEFLCENCKTFEAEDMDTRIFLLNYYSSIKPFLNNTKMKKSGKITENKISNLFF